MRTKVGFLVLLVLLFSEFSIQSAEIPSQRFALDLTLTRETIIKPEGLGFSMKILPGNGSAEVVFHADQPYAVQLETGTVESFIISGTREIKTSLPARFSIFSPGRVIHSVGGRGIQNGCFLNPTYLTRDKLGRIYVSDTGNDRVQVFDQSGSFVSQFGSFGVATDIASSENEIFNSGSLARFNHPEGIAVATEIFIADRENHRIVKFDRFGNMLRFFGKYGNGRNEFDTPLDLALDDQKNLYVVDSENHRLKKYDSNGYLLLKIGNYGQAPGQFIRPCSIAAADQSLFVIDSGNHRLQKFDENGGFQAQGQFPDNFGTGRGVSIFESLILLTVRDRIAVFDKCLHLIGEFPIPDCGELFGIIQNGDFLVVTDNSQGHLLYLLPGFASIKLSPEAKAPG
ncbi:MAG: NHL repeat-containing protein [Candidatus Wallbacteria bacterium]|nr:NHL repeat-containing protein [Candidatus Wallbacteria bacterium]